MPIPVTLSVVDAKAHAASTFGPIDPAAKDRFVYWAGGTVKLLIDWRLRVAGH